MFGFVIDCQLCFTSFSALLLSSAKREGQLSKILSRRAKVNFFTASGESNCSNAGPCPPPAKLVFLLTLFSVRNRPPWPQHLVRAIASGKIGN